MRLLGRRCGQQLVQARAGTKGDERDVTKERMRWTDSLTGERARVTALLVCVSSKDHKSAKL